MYKVSATWAAHEGSVLLWILVLAGWTLAVATFSRQLPDEFRALVLGVLGWLSRGIPGLYAVDVESIRSTVSCRYQTGVTSIPCSRIQPW